MPSPRAYIALAGLVLAFLDSHDGKEDASGGTYLFAVRVSAFHPNTYEHCFNRRIGKVGRSSNTHRCRSNPHCRSKRTHPGGIGSIDFRSQPAMASRLHASDSSTTNNFNTTDTGADSGGKSNATSNSYRKNRLQVTPDLVADLKSSIPLTQVVESFNLPQFRQTSPTRAVALCPFHNDNNPSMHIDDERGLYKCFSCGAGGDVFNFVREYKLVEEGGEKMGFIDAVIFVAEEYADGSLSSGTGGESSSSSRFRAQQGEGSAELTKEQRVRRERLALANAAAAEFYGKCLASLPGAGAARSHLRARGVQPETVRRFALGFAPDAYFGQQGKRGARVKWGEGSLVERLKGLGFTAEEITDAGLATRINRRNEKKELNDYDTKSLDDIAVANATESEIIENNNDDKSYADLMDRFRGRLVVPIFDDDGRRVVAFGGRHIDGPPSSSSADSSVDRKFTPAKYLNSPETQIFSKKEMLFGVAAAKKVIDDRRVEYAKATLGSAPLAPAQSANVPAPCLVVVEGYFDVISLASSGIKEAVASMGTALTQEQLGVAAKVIGPGASKIILCFDSDEAGQIALERLCESNILSKTVQKHGVNIHIATISDKEIKDPADFVAARGGDAFRREVLDISVPWTEWYINRLASNHQIGDSKDSDTAVDSSQSLVDICDEISTFLASFSSAERTRMAYTAASTLAQIYSDQNVVNGTAPQVSTSSLQIQLESDILSKASRKAGARDAIADRIERIESADTLTLSSQSTFASPGALVSKMSSGEGVTSLVDEMDYALPPADDGDKRHKERSYEYEDDKFGSVGDANTSSNNRRRSDQSEGFSSRHPFPKNAKTPPLTPHFSGFEFANPTDAAWLGFYNGSSGTRRKDPPLVAGGGALVERRLMREAIEAGETYVSLNNENKLVYFNSNAFHGNKFLTKEAREAGYGENGITYDASEIGLGVPALVEQDSDKLLLDAEDRLLRALVHYPSARAAIKGAVMTSLKSGSGAGFALIEWSNQNREWLFECLTDSPGRTPLPSELQEGGTAQQLRDYLAELSDAPLGAFDSGVSSVDAKNPLTDTILEGGSRTRETGTEGEALDSSLFDDPSSTPFATHGPVGRLETYFSNNDEADSLAPYQKSELSGEIRAELLVQETLAAMLRATALRRMALLKKRWMAAATALELRLNENTKSGYNADNATILAIDDAAPGEVENSRMYSDANAEVDELSSLCSTLGEQLSEAMQTVKELDESSKRIGSRLMDFCSTGGSSYRMSTAKREKFIKMLDDHLENLPEDPKPTTSGGDGGYIFGIDEFDDSIDSQFGGVYSDELAEDGNNEDTRYSGIVEDYEDYELDDDEGIY